LTRIYDNAPGNTVNIMIGDANAKIGKEAYYVPTIGFEGAHDLRNDNGGRLISFAASRNMIISSTIFPHKRIHKLTWSAPDRRTKNQIDHLLIEKKFRCSITDVKSYRGADCDSDHFLVIANFRVKWQRI